MSSHLFSRIFRSPNAFNSVDKHLPRRHFFSSATVATTACWPNTSPKTAKHVLHNGLASSWKMSVRCKLTFLKIVLINWKAEIRAEEATGNNDSGLLLFPPYEWLLRVLKTFYLICFMDFEGDHVMMMKELLVKHIKNSDWSERYSGNDDAICAQLRAVWNLDNRSLTSYSNQKCWAQYTFQQYLSWTWAKKSTFVMLLRLSIYHLTQIKILLWDSSGL